MIGIICQAAVLFLFAVYSVMDIRDRKVWTPLAVIMGIAGIGIHLASGDRAAAANLYALLPGILLAALALVSGEAIGYGDCLAIGACGALTGIRHACMVTFLAMLLAGMWAILLIVRKGAGRGTRFPFVPFLFIAQLLLILL